MRVSTRATLAALVVASTLTLACQGAAAAVPPSGFFGVGGWSYPTSHQAASLGAAGLRLVRAGVSWANIQPSRRPSSRNWRSLNLLANEAAKDGFNLVLDFNGCTVWACGMVRAAPRGAALKAFEHFVAAAVARYEPSSSFWKGKPHIPTITWQVWNEVNAGYFWPNPTPASYAKFLGEISATIKAVDPSASVIMSGLTGLPGASSDGVGVTRFLRGLFKQPGFAQSTAAIVVHGYSTSPGGSLAILDEARSVMLANNDAAQPIWVTEMSWASGGPPGPFTVSAKTQKAWLVKTWDTMLACAPRWNLQHVLWFSLQNESYRRQSVLSFTHVRPSKGLRRAGDADLFKEPGHAARRGAR